MQNTIITIEEFFDVYGISLIYNTLSKQDQKYAASLIDDIAKKYVDVTLYAVRNELEHAEDGGEGYGLNFNDEKLVKLNLGLKMCDFTSHKGKKKIDFQKAIVLFRKLHWDPCFGGYMWADIAEAGLELERLLPATTHNIKKVIEAIDFLNDLEHNSELYLEQSFASGYDEEINTLYEALEFKYECKPEEIFKRCSKDLRNIIYKQYKGLIHTK